MLSKRQKETLDFIIEYIHTHHYAPVLATIAEGLGIRSRSTANRYVQALIEKGYLRRAQHQQRALELTAKSPEVQFNKTYQPSIPLVGTIAAGKPIEAIETHQDIVLSKLLSGDNLYMLHVSGDSMIEEGILDGDYVICERRDNADNGEIVVALIDQQEVTLKRIYWLAPDCISLRPANATMQPMIYTADRIEIQGVLRAQLRTYG